MRWTQEIDAKVTGAREGADDLRDLRSELLEAQRALEAFQAARAMPAAPIANDGPAFSKTGYHDPIADSPWAKLKNYKGGALPGEKGGGAKQAEEAAGAIKKAGGASSASMVKLGKDLGGVAGIMRAGVAAAAVYAGVTGAAGLAQIAMGYQGVARLQAISYRASLDVRRLFTGVDAQPLIRAADRFEKNLSKSTVTGNALSGILTRGFNGFFSVIERVEPYFTAMAQGALIAGLYVEQGILRARVALLPYTDALEDAIGVETGLEQAAWAGGLAIAGLGVYAAAATAPLLPFAAAIGAVAAALQQLSALVREWDSKSISRDLRQKLGLSSQEETERALGIRTGAEADSISTDRARVAAEKQKDARGQGVNAASSGATGEAGPAGHASGDALAQGIIKGMGAQTAALRAAGAKAVDAANQGVVDKAQIHSPSVLFRGHGRNMGLGAIGGLEDTAPDVQRAAERSLVPDLRGAVGGGGARGSTPSISVAINAHFPNVRSGRGDDIRAALEQAAPFLSALILRDLQTKLAAGGP